MDTGAKAIADVQTVFLALIKTLVDDQEAVMLKVKTIGTETVFHLYVSKRDLGKIIGKQGRTARALRALLIAAGMKYTQRFELAIDAQAEPAA